MIHVAHDGDHRSARFKARVLLLLGGRLLLYFLLARLDLETQFKGQAAGHLDVNRLVDGGHDALGDEPHDHLVGIEAHFFGEFLDGGRLVHHDPAGLRRGLGALLFLDHPAQFALLLLGAAAFFLLLAPFGVYGALTFLLFLGKTLALQPGLFLFGAAAGGGGALAFLLLGLALGLLAFLALFLGFAARQFLGLAPRVRGSLAALILAFDVFTGALFLRLAGFGDLCGAPGGGLRGFSRFFGGFFHRGLGGGFGFLHGGGRGFFLLLHRLGGGLPLLRRGAAQSL